MNTRTIHNSPPQSRNLSIPEAVSLKAQLKKISEELELFKFLTENAAGEIYLVRSDMRIIYVNKAVCRDLGYSREEMCKKQITDFDLEFTPEKWQRFISDLQHSAGPKTIETRHTDKNGNVVIKEVTSLLVDYRSKKYVLGVAKNITKRKQAEEALIESEERFRFIFEFARDGIFVTSPQDHVLLWNREAERLFGYSDEDLLNMSVTTLLARPQEVKRIKDKLKKNLTLRNFEIDAQRKDGSTFPIAMTIWVERDQRKNVRRTYAIVRDISEAKKLEKEKLEIEKLYSTKILLKEMEREKTELEERFLQNINTLLLPTLEKLKGQDLPEITNSYLSLLEDNLKNIASPLSRKLLKFYQQFSPREIEVADLIRKGKSSKEIGEVLCISPAAVNFHRLNIRRKIGIKSTKQNLQVVLKAFS